MGAQMKILHIYRSAPVTLVQVLVSRLPKGGSEIKLYEGAVDYDRLVAEIFSSDRVICWW